MTDLRVPENYFFENLIFKAGIGQPKKILRTLIPHHRQPPLYHNQNWGHLEEYNLISDDFGATYNGTLDYLLFDPCTLEESESETWIRP